MKLRWSQVLDILQHSGLEPQTLRWIDASGLYASLDGLVY